MRSLLLILILACSSNTFATNYFVNSLQGNKSYNGLTSSRPKSTIQQAADLTKPGDTVFVMNGVYTNDCPTCNVVNIPNSGTASKYIVYINYPKHLPKISFNGWAGISIRNGISYIKIIGF